MKYLCFDLGLTHTGVAVSEEGKLVTPLSTSVAKDRQTLLKKITTLIISQQPDQVLLGRPSHGPITDLADWLAQQLTSYPVLLVTEDHSTKAASRHLYEQNLSITTRHKKQHSLAAAIILEEYLDSLVE